MKTALFVTYLFYPGIAVGAKRTVKFIKYLPKHGIRPVVLTVKERYYDRIDRQLKAAGVTAYRTACIKSSEKPVNANIIRFAAYYAKRLFESCMFPDKYLSWLPFAVFRSKQIFKENKIDLIISSGPPFTGFLIAYLLKKLYGKPLVLDFRDQWRFSKTRNLVLKPIVRTADCIVFSTRHILNLYTEWYPGLSKTKLIVLPNSFDPEDFTEIVPVKKDKLFRIAYAGTFYGRRSPRHFLQALSGLHADGRISESNFRFLSIGNLTYSMIDDKNLHPLIELRGFLPFRESLQLLAASDALLVIVGDRHGPNIPAKIYEYLAIRKPILVVCPQKSAVVEIIENTNSGVIADLDSISEIKAGIMKMLDGNGKWYDGTGTEIEEYSCLKATERLAAAFAQYCFNGDPVTKKEIKHDPV